MLCPRPTPLNRRPTVQNLPNPHRAHPPAKRVRCVPSKFGSLEVQVLYQMLGRRIADRLGIEGAPGVVAGLGLLDVGPS